MSQSYRTLDVIHYFLDIEHFGDEHHDDTLSIKIDNSIYEIDPSNLLSRKDIGLDFNSPVYNTSNSPAQWGNVFFDNWHNYSKPFVGKTIEVFTDNLIDADGASAPALSESKWYQYDGASHFQEVHTGSHYTITSSDIGYQILVKPAFLDDLGHVETWVGSDEDGNPIEYVRLNSDGVLGANAKLNTTRITKDYSIFENYLNQNSIPLGNIDLLLGDSNGNVSKWGTSYGTSETLTYSITPAGVMSYSTDYVNDLSWYASEFTEAEALAMSTFYSDLNSLSSGSGLGAIEFSSSEITDIETALGDWSDITGITFNEVANSTSDPADIIFTKLDFNLWQNENAVFNPEAAGFAFLPTGDDNFHVGDVFIGKEFGNLFIEVVSHEIGHALGFSHPHDGRQTYTDAANIPNYHTIMSYDNEYNFAPVTPMQLDLDAASALYGVNTSANITNDPYVINVDNLNPISGWSERLMIHDVGGNDTLTLNSTLNSGTFINLNPGSFSNFSSATPIIDDASTWEFGNLYISSDTQIETLSSTNGMDRIDASVHWSAIVNAGDGDDIIMTSGYGGVYDGGVGNDTLEIKASDYDLLYVEATDATSGNIKLQTDDSVYCTATNIEFIQLLDGANRPTSDPVSWQALEALMPKGTQVTDTYTPAVGSNEEMFEIAIAERYGDIIEFGVRLKDDTTTGISDQQSTVTFENIMLDVFWDTDTYDWWQGQFTASPNAPSTTDLGTGAATDFDYYYDNDWRFEEAFKNDGTLKTDTDGNQIYVDADGVEQLDSGGFAVTNETYYARDGSVVPVYGIDQDRFNITMVDNGGMTFEENEFVAKFMLKKKTDETESPFTLGKQQYTVYNPSVTDGDKEKPVSEDFYFGFNSHQVGFEIESPRGKEVPNMEMFVTDLSTSDGLSIVPVAKNGDIIKYEVVLNIPTPSFIAGIDVNPNHYIEIHGAGIFENSIQMLTDLSMVSDDGSVSTLTQTGEILNGTTSATSTVKNANGDTLSPDVAIKGSYIGQEFFHKMNAAFDDDLSGSINDLKTTGEITLEFNNLSMPNATKDTAEARYVLAEFYALDHGRGGSAIQFESTSLSSTDYTDQSSYVLDGTGIRSITRDYDDTSSSFNGGFFKELADGSEYVILGDGLYANENSYDDAVGAEDALGALRIANMETTPGASAGPYTIEQIIAADFNQNGSVTVGDAADILSYIVHGFEDTLAVPEWVYVNTANITKGTATTNFNGSNVVYDTVIDEFAYGSTNYTDVSFDYDGVTHTSLGTLTGILRGDVSASYDDAGRWTTIDQFSHGIKGLYMFGHLSPGTTSEGDAGYWSSTSDNVVYLGADSGVHNVGDAHIVIVSDVIAGHLDGVSASSVEGTAFDSADLGSSPKPTDADILSEMANAVGTDDYAVGFWEDTDDYDPTIMATAIEMDSTTGITIDDLVIVGNSGMHIVGLGDYMSDPFAYLPDA